LHEAIARRVGLNLPTGAHLLARDGARARGTPPSQGEERACGVGEAVAENVLADAEFRPRAQVIDSVGPSRRPETI